jgi:hypothetical protein
VPLVPVLCGTVVIAGNAPVPHLPTIVCSARDTSSLPTRDLCHGQIWRNFTSPPVQMEIHSGEGTDAHLETERSKGGTKHD